MKLEQNEESFLFATTKIPDIFFAEYLSEASRRFYQGVFIYIIFI